MRAYKFICLFGRILPLLRFLIRPYSVRLNSFCSSYHTTQSVAMMAQPQPRYALSFESYQKDICRGLASLQQNGEYVDMTIAADGHLVRVHKMIMSLASPYFKEIIDSAEGQQPMIYLNKVSYPVLSSILEYVYSGQTHVDAYDLDEFMQVAKDLHISGLTGLDLDDKEFNKVDAIKYKHEEEVAKMMQRQGLQKTSTTTNVTSAAPVNTTSNQGIYMIKSQDNAMDSATEEYFEVEEQDDVNDQESQAFNDETQKKEITSADNKALYTVSNQGTIQMIFNRFVYALNYLYLKKPGYRKWRCVEAKEHKCPAIIVTQEDRVVKRQRAHTHPFHDKRILKRMKDRAVFTAISDLKKAFGDQTEETAAGSENE